MARYIDADALIEMLNNKAKTDLEMGLYNHGALTQSFIKFVERQPTADVVPRAELAVRSFQDAATIYDLQKKLVVATETLKYILSDLKKKIHDRAVYPHNAGIDPYISLKVVDAIIEKEISHTKGGG